MQNQCGNIAQIFHITAQKGAVVDAVQTMPSVLGQDIQTQTCTGWTTGREIKETKFEPLRCGSKLESNQPATKEKEKNRYHCFRLKQDRESRLHSQNWKLPGYGP